MAGETELLPGLDQHLGIGRTMRIMAGIAFAVFYRLVFDLGGDDELSEFLVLMAVGTNLQ